MNRYFDWVGLPHRTGADPDDGVGADCLVVAHRILSEAGIQCPPIDQHWFELAREKKWVALYREWDKHMEKLDSPEEYAVYMKPNNETGLAIGVIVGDGMIIVHHRKGVCWIPVSLVKGPFWRVRRASC